MSDSATTKEEEAMIRKHGENKAAQRNGREIKRRENRGNAGGGWMDIALETEGWRNRDEKGFFFSRVITPHPHPGFIGTLAFGQ